MSFALFFNYIFVMFASENLKKSYEASNLEKHDGSPLAFYVFYVMLLLLREPGRNVRYLMTNFESFTRNKKTSP